VYVIHRPSVIPPDVALSGGDEQPATPLQQQLAKIPVLG
jgi:hypothetical protein